MYDVFLYLKVRLLPLASAPYWPLLAGSPAQYTGDDAAPPALYVLPGLSPSICAGGGPGRSVTPTESV
ncbi:hypothetical protein NDU88_005761 [Pleurodeles waltl]|uniref:Uncharacterized protein n=1 Tax=Pleurodeles waltl TaxID=8319 RepID=A0AAV7TBP1_PLEWA|nr:hypothetical protein NDU88_005761 [Pleurodeles waltl]